MNTKILISLSIIGAVAAIAITGTVAYFSDTETSQGNTITAGIVDIVVDDQNPWTNTYSETLEDMKPCQTRYIEFIIRNLEESNEVDIWKHIDIVSQEDGTITEPECTEGKGTWTGGGTVCTEAVNCCINYTPRNNLAAYTIYDMYVCEDPVEQTTCLTNEDGKPTGGGWQAIITENQYVRLDIISSAWIYLGRLNPAKELKVVQSYHLRSWPDAPEPEVTNWAQGDIMTFNIDLYAEQLGGSGPKGAQAMVTLENKDPVTWEVISDGISGTLTYNTSGSTFDYSLTATGLALSTSYDLIYYADPWPGNGGGGGGALINTHMTDGGGNINVAAISKELGMDLPSMPDNNYPGGAKIWLVPSSDYNSGTNSLTAWNPTNYLFETNLISYDDIDIP